MLGRCAMRAIVDALRFLSSFPQGLWFCYVAFREQKIVETQALFACEAKAISLKLTLLTGFQLPSLFVTPPDRALRRPVRLSLDAAPILSLTFCLPHHQQHTVVYGTLGHTILRSHSSRGCY